MHKAVWLGNLPTGTCSMVAGYTAMDESTVAAPTCLTAWPQSGSIDTCTDVRNACSLENSCMAAKQTCKQCEPVVSECFAGGQRSDVPYLKIELASPPGVKCPDHCIHITLQAKKFGGRPVVSTSLILAQSYMQQPATPPTNPKLRPPIARAR